MKTHYIRIEYIVFISCAIGLCLLALTVGHLYQQKHLADQESALSRSDRVKIEKLLKLSQTAYERNLHELHMLKRQDQYLLNKSLETEIASIQNTYEHGAQTYESLLDLKDSAKQTAALDSALAQGLQHLSQRRYASAEAIFVQLDKDIAAEKAKVTSSFVIPATVQTALTPPGSGYRRQKVDTPVGSYLVDVIAADLNSTRVIADTASDGDCRDGCPVMGLAAYAGRSGAFAGINGPYFCPASYPSCSGKSNSFDTLLMNKAKTYFNSDNNVYSSVPAVIFSGNSARFVSASQDWGRDTSVDAVIASQPLLMLNGTRVFGGDGEPKRTGKGSRSFIGATGSTVYIGVVHNASTAEVAHVLETLGISHALNLDSGGSTALWNQGRYIVGPGRDTPFGILFVGK